MCRSGTKRKLAATARSTALRSTSTYIRSGVKIDNICHIAHNCDLGENGFYTAGFMMGGLTKIGRQFVTGGNSVVTAHVDGHYRAMSASPGDRL